MSTSIPTLPESLVALLKFGDVLAWLVIGALLIWTLRQYDQPRRFIELPKTVDEPETDDDDDRDEFDQDLRDAA